MAEKALPFSPKVGGIVEKGAISGKPVKKLPGLPSDLLAGVYLTTRVIGSGNRV